MEGRRVFKDLTVEENLMAGAYTRKDRKNLKEDMEKILCLFSKTKSTSTLESRISYPVESNKCLRLEGESWRNRSYCYSMNHL